MHRKHDELKNIIKRLRSAQKSALEKGLPKSVIQQFHKICNYNEIEIIRIRKKTILMIIVFVFLIFPIVVTDLLNSLLSARCLLPINHLVWEATRPLSDCTYCTNVTRPIILQNITRDVFKSYAYSSKPIIVKNAIIHWRALKGFSYHMFKQLYEQTLGSYESIDEGCQFLNFKSDLYSLKEVFSMAEARVRNEQGQKPWYVGWGNCHPDILTKVRQYYSIPDFLPEDAEFPATENIFFGYEIGAVMHLDYIPRLMWQGQVKGNKFWFIAPVPECEHICHKIQYYVEQGDIVLLDTRLWYHATSIPKGEFSITVQSEYG